MSPDVQNGRGQLVIQGNPWHYRVYKFWQNESKYDGPYYRDGYRRENLCHYVRVILLWAPLTWFFVVPLNRSAAKLNWVRPWMVAFLVLALGGIATAFHLAPAGSLEVLFFTLVMIGLMAGMLGLLILLHPDCFNLFGRIKRWIQWHKKPSSAKTNTKTSMVNVLVHRAVAKKQKVCPFIVLPGSNDTPQQRIVRRRRINGKIPPSDRWWGPIGR